MPPGQDARAGSETAGASPAAIIPVLRPVSVCHDVIMQLVQAALLLTQRSAVWLDDPIRVPIMPSLCLRRCRSGPS